MALDNQPLPSNDLTKDDILDELNKPDEVDNKEDDKLDIKVDAEDDEESEDDKSQRKSSKKDTDSVKDDEEDREEDIEVELEALEDDDEKLQLDTIPRRKEILKEFPQLFKKFPGIEKAIYREQKYAEMFPTIEDARQAEDKVKALDRFETELMGGSLEGILKAVKGHNPSAFTGIVNNYHKVLATVDRDAYDHIISNVVKSAVLHVAQLAKNDNDNDLMEIAQQFYKAVSGGQKFSPPEELKITDKKEDDEVSRREQEITFKQLDREVTDLNSRVNNVLKSTVEQHIDPKGVMTPYVRSKVIEDVIEQVNNQLRGDSRFRLMQDRLWERAMKDDYSNASLDAIRRAYLSKAKVYLPDIIKKSRNDALRGLGRRSEDVKDKDRSGSLSGGDSTRRNNSGQKTNELKQGEKTLDFLMRD